MIKERSARRAASRGPSEVAQEMRFEDFLRRRLAYDAPERVEERERTEEELFPPALPCRTAKILGSEVR